MQSANPSLRPSEHSSDAVDPDRILTTHVGSLPRPQPVVDVLFAQDRGDEHRSRTARGGAAAERERGRSAAGGRRARRRQRRRDEQDQLRHLHPASADRIRRRLGTTDAAGPGRLSRSFAISWSAKDIRRPTDGRCARGRSAIKDCTPLVRDIAPSAARDGRIERGGRLHDRRLAGHGRRVPSESGTTDRTRRTCTRSPPRCGPSTRRSSAPGSSCRSIARIWRWAATRASSTWTTRSFCAAQRSTSTR